MESKYISVYKSDIKNIGHTVYGRDMIFGDGDKACFVCDLKTANIEKILLREILKLYGYEIEETFYGHSNDGVSVPVGSIDFFTNMPWKEYMALD
jgi:hypothetical protein